MFKPEDIIAECRFAAVRSSGKGGQNVNKVSTKVVLQFDILNSSCFTDAEKERLLLNLAGKVSDAGILAVSASDGRSQADNRKLAEYKLVKLITKGLKEKKERIATQVPQAEKEKRIRDKKAQSGKKSQRTLLRDDDFNP